jgi:TonB family protein
MKKMLLTFFCTLLLTSAYGQSFLNGVSAYEQLNKEYYLGALYTVDAINDPAEILADTRPQKMVIRVTAKRWSPHKFNELWRQDISLNNSFANKLELTKAVIAFTDIPKENLTLGDELEINYNSNQGTIVSLNGYQVLSHPGKELFNALINTWIGEVPPSRLFQSDILGQEAIVTSNKDVLIERFDNLSINPQRLDLVGKWQAAQQAAAAALAQAEEELRQQKINEEIAKQRAAEEKKRLEEERKAAVALAAKRKQEAEAAKKKQQQNTEATEAEKVEIAAAIKAQEEAEARAAELENKQDDSNQQVLAKEYAERLYRWEVQRDVYKRVSYPEWARQFDQEGLVRIEFIVNDKGQMVGITSITPEDSGLLGQELKEAISRAAPFKVFPSELASPQLAITIEYEFSLEDRIAELPEMPKAPAELKKNTEVSLAEQAVIWQNYKQQIKADISSAIEYPFWAQDLKQQGVVKVEVTVSRQGIITNAKLTKKTRHAILNQEILDATERVGGFEPFPEWINESSVTVSIEHEFKI